MHKLYSEFRSMEKALDVSMLRCGDGYKLVSDPHNRNTEGVYFGGTRRECWLEALRLYQEKFKKPFSDYSSENSASYSELMAIKAHCLELNLEFKPHARFMGQWDTCDLLKGDCELTTNVSMTTALIVLESISKCMSPKPWRA